MKRKLGLFLLPVFLLGSLTGGVAQQRKLTFDHLSVQKGLSQGNVWDIHQDHLGFIWIATEDGLNRYDGYSFQVYKNNPLDTASLSSNNIRCIAEDAQGNLWVGTREGLNFYNREEDRFGRFVNDPDKPGSISNNLIGCILLDDTGKVWVGTNNGLNLFDPVTQRFKAFFHEPANAQSLLGNSVRALRKDSQNQIWIGTNNGLNVLNRDGKTFTGFTHHPADPSTLSSNNIVSVLEDKDHILWVGTFDGGLNKRDGSKNTFVHYAFEETNEKSLPNNYVYDLAEDRNGRLWVATDNGLSQLNKGDGTFFRYHHNEDDPTTLSSNIITKVLLDRNDRMWVGSRFGGVDIYDKNKYDFINYQHHSFDKNSLSNNTISTFKEDEKGNVWVATDGGSLNYFDRKKDTFTAYLNTFTSNKVLAVERDLRGGLWIGMWQGGVNYFDPATHRIKRYRNDPRNPKSLSNDNVFYILRDHTGTIWIATWGNGLNKYNPETDDFTRYVHDPANPNTVGSAGLDYLMEDSQGTIWIGTEQEGVDRFDPVKNTFVHYKTSTGKNSLTNNFVSVIYEDSKKRIWVGTYAGLNLYDPQTETFHAYREYDGLPNDAIMGIQEDGNNRLWISTNHGISCFDPERHTFKNFTEDDGLQGNQFTRWASARLTTGELLFGGTNGFTLFHPDSIKSNSFIPPVYITGFKVFNKRVAVGREEILKKNIVRTSVIQLSYKEDMISFEFAALNYLQSEKNRYKYRLAGFQDEWMEAGEERKASYTNLSPGEYVFQVIASNNDGVWNEKGASVKIVIVPPYWQTWWFQSLAVFLILGGLTMVFQMRINSTKRLKRMLEEKIRQGTSEITDQKEVLEAQAEDMQALNEQLQAQTEFLQQINAEIEEQREEADRARKEAEKANQAKSIFLATMSHEIRTPMNGVLGMAALLAETPLTAEQKEYTDTIRASGEALLTVINDILDFSKIESGHLELDNHAFDLRQCIEDVLDIFSSKASQKGMDLVYQIDYQIPAQIISDSHRLRQILINLIGNAMKFTHQGEIFVGIDLLKMDASQVELAFQIRDTGIGIPQDKLSRLFKAFSQVDSSTTRKYGGTGLGLVISQRLVGLMGGTIAVESQVGVGTSFGFTIKGWVSQESIRQYVNTNLAGNEGKKILVVDDNFTNLTILKAQLEQWKLIPAMASSGSDALQIVASGEKFDLVITDMQMPDMDGVQLTQQIKAQYPSLPVILLSSMGDESKKKYPRLFSAVLNKPVKQQQLLRVLHSVLREESVQAETQQTRQVLSENFAIQYPLRILIAEDNPINQKLAIRVLNRLGYHEIDLAQTGLEAVAKFEKQFYDMILMDVQMPEMDGLEATRLIRLNKQRNQPVIISMTANAMQGDREECMIAGMDDYVSKPVKLEIMVSILERWALKINGNEGGHGGSRNAISSGHSS